MDARTQQIVDLEAALERAVTRYDALLKESGFQLNALHKELRYVREQYAALEALYNGALARLSVLESPPCG